MELTDNNTYHDLVDQVESVIVNQGTPVECPIKHLFTKGVYCREMFVPKGTILTSKLHNMQHPFVLSMGCVGVVENNKVTEVMQAPFLGVTEPGTRRIIYAYEDSVWTTFHPVSIYPESDSDEDLMKAVQLVEDLVIDEYENKLITINKKEELT